MFLSLGKIELEIIEIMYNFTNILQTILMMQTLNLVKKVNRLKNYFSGTYAYEIFTFPVSYNELYDNIGEQCQTKEETLPRIDYTGTTCDSKSKNLKPRNRHK